MGGVMIHALASACVVLLFHYVHHMLAEECRSQPLGGVPRLLLCFGNHTVSCCD